MAQEITPALLDATYVGFHADFQGAQERTPVWYTDLATEIPSTTLTEVQGFMERIPKLRKWLGPRQMNNLAAQAYSLTNDKFELSFAVKREDIEDSRLHLYGPAVADMGEAAKKWPDQLVKAAIQAGTTSICFDGKNFFDTTHFIQKAKGRGAQSNNFTVTPLSWANYVAVKQAMRSLVGPDDEPLSQWGSIALIVPPQLESVAKTIIKADTIVATGPGATSAAVTNTEKDGARIIVIPELLNQPTTWYLADLSGSFKPLVFQRRYSPDFVALQNPNDANVFELDEYRYGTRARGAAGYGLWWKMARAIA